MRVEYAPRAVRDLQEIGSYYRTAANERVAVAVAQRIGHVVNLIARQPSIAPLVPRSTWRLRLQRRRSTMLSKS